MSATRWAYRPGLDGLRCVAVLLVVGFHARLSWFANGFVGVDVFFVLSGFLVTSVVLAADLDDFGFGRFYARRVRRLLPAAVVAVVVASASLLLYVPRLTRGGLVSDAQAALLYVANWHFIQESTDYFADDLEASPFLHYWSLAIEEQFYLLYPFVLLGIYRVARRRLDADSALRVVGIGVAVLAAASLLVQIRWAGDDVLRAYYGTDARLYQLLVGGAVAVAMHRRRPRGFGSLGRVADPVAALALVATVVVATDTVSMSVSTRGFVITALAIVLIVALDIGQGSTTATLLGLPVPRYLGQISYMIYLVHWPLILLLREGLDLGPTAVAVLATAGSVALAAVSFALLEQPIRRGRWLAARPIFSVAAGLSLSVVVAVVVVPPLLRSDVKPPIEDRAPLAIEDIDLASAAPEAEPAPLSTVTPESRDETASADGAASPTPAPSPTPVDSEAVIEALLAEPVPPGLDYEAALVRQPGNRCASVDGNGCVMQQGTGAHVHLIGDSNAAMLRPMLLALAADHDLTYSESTFQGCTWQRGLATSATIDECYELRESWYEHLSAELMPDVIIAVNLGYTFEPDPRTATWVAYDGEPVGIDDREVLLATVAERTAAAVDELTTGGAKLVMIEPAAYDYTLDTAACLSGAEVVGECAFVRPPVDPIASLYRAIAAGDDNSISLDLDPFACPQLSVCLPLIDGRIVYSDRSHLSADHTVGARAQFTQLLRDAGVDLG